MGIKQPLEKKPRTKPKTPPVRELLELATRHLLDAKERFSRHSFGIALEAAQDAARTAVRALLVKQAAKTPETDRGFLDAFQKEGVQAGLFTPEYTKMLEDILTSQATELEVREAIKNTESFLEKVRCVVT